MTSGLPSCSTASICAALSPLRCVLVWARRPLPPPSRPARKDYFLPSRRPLPPPRRPLETRPHLARRPPREARMNVQIRHEPHRAPTLVPLPGTSFRVCAARNIAARCSGPSLYLPRGRAPDPATLARGSSVVRNDRTRAGLLVHDTSTAALQRMSSQSAGEPAARNTSSAIDISSPDGAAPSMSNSSTDLGASTRR